MSNRTTYKSDVSSSINPMSRLMTSEANRTILTSSQNPENLSRYYGGIDRYNHPYVSGYWYCLILPPPRLFNITEGNDNATAATEWLHSTAEGFTPPTRNLKKVEAPGIGGVKSYYVAGQEINREFTITFREYQELPILNILQNWTSVIDSNTGVSPLAGSEYVPANYKGIAYIALCKPTVGTRDGDAFSGILDGYAKINREDIEQLFFFDGVVPKSLPYDTLNNDISNNDMTTISVPFSFDGYPLMKDSPKVVDNFLTAISGTNASNSASADSKYNISTTYSKYLNAVTTARITDPRA